MGQVLRSAKSVVEEAIHVSIQTDPLKRLAQQMVCTKTEVPSWPEVYHFKRGEEETLFYLIVLDSLNFCFWPAQGKEKWKVRCGDQWLGGYYALSYSLKRAFETGRLAPDAKSLAGMSLERLKDILQGRGELQLLGARLEILHELSHVLLKNFKGKACNLVSAASNSSPNLVDILAQNLLSFRDVAEYAGKKVFFYKRAQILAADLYGAFEGRTWGYFKDMDQLTAFADYKLPQALRHVGVLAYEPGLAEKVDNEVVLEAGSAEEVEIRASTIWGVELIRRELAAMGKDLNAYEIDWFLWNMGQKPEFKKKPHHRTVTIFY